MGKPITPEALAERVDGAYGDICDLVVILTMRYDEVVADFNGEVAAEVRELSRRLGTYVHPSVLFVFMAGAVGDLIEELSTLTGTPPEDYVARFRNDAASEVAAAEYI